MMGNEHKWQWLNGQEALQPPQYKIYTRRIRHWFFWSKWVYDLDNGFLVLLGLDDQMLDEFISQVGSRNVRFVEGNFAK